MSRPELIARVVLAALTAYAVALACYSFVSFGWKPHRVETAWILFGAAVLAGLCARSAWPAAATIDAGRPGSRLILPGLIVVTAALYARALQVGYLSDDFVLLETAAWSGWQQGDAGLFRVLPLLVIQGVNNLLRTQAEPWLHGLNVALHCASGALVYAVARQLTLSGLAALAASALFLLYPAATEAVAWISGLQDVMAVAFILSFVWLALSGGNPLLLALPLAAGLLSKETAVVMPLLAAAALWARGVPPGRPLVRMLWGCGVIAAAFAVWRLAAGDPASATIASRYMAKEILANALGTLALPWTRAELAEAWLVGPLAVAWVTLAAWAAMAKSASPVVPRVALLGLVWVIAGVAPVNRLFFISDWLEGSRYLYLSSAGWALACAGALDAPGYRRALAAVTAAVLAAWTVTLYVHVGVWREAGQVRDQLLRAAAQIPASPECSAPAFENVVDNVRGAYVFRNGFGQALRRANGSAGPRSAATPCRYRWDGERFSRVE